MATMEMDEETGEQTGEQDTNGSRSAVSHLVIDALKGRVTINRGVLAIDIRCEGSAHHSPQPLLLRRVRLCPWLPAGPILDGVQVYDHSDMVWLCATCADNLAVLQELFKMYDGDLDWPLRRQFGNRVRALAERGWALYKDND